jgi:hypothetical protein
MPESADATAEWVREWRKITVSAAAAITIQTRAEVARADHLRTVEFTQTGILAAPRGLIFVRSQKIDPRRSSRIECAHGDKPFENLCHPRGRHWREMKRCVPMLPRAALLLPLACAGSIVPAAAQNTSDQYRPELGIYYQATPIIRVESIDFASGTQSTHQWEGNFAYYVEAALKPVIRRRLREHPDAYREKYLTVRAGYRYETGLTNGNSTSGNLGIIELTSRYLLPRDFVITDRNRGDFRFLQGKPFDTRYRNRFRLERDLKHGRFVCTPYAFDEIFYDTSYDRWTPNRYAAGAEFPAGRHMVFDAYYMRQNSSRSNPPHLNIFGLRWNLHFQ